MHLHDMRRRDLEQVTGKYNHQDWSLGDYNDVFKIVILVITGYLLLNDTIILIQSCYRRSEESSGGELIKSSISVLLHTLLIFNIERAIDDVIVEESFWSLQSWVSLLMWTRIIMQNLGDIEAMSWLIGLI